MQEPVIPLRITAIDPLTDGIAAFYLQPVMPMVLNYKAGQFLNFLFRTAGGEVRRAYSIAESPLANAPLRVIVKRIPNGIASRRLLDAAKAGDVLQALAPQGLFTLPADPDSFGQIFFFAAGVGITPVFSLIKTLLLLRHSPEIVLIYSNRTEKHTILKEELVALQNSHHGLLKIEWLFSNAPNARYARLSSVLMPELIKRYATALLSKVLCYTCGPIGYMWMVSTLLHQYGVPLVNIRREVFETALPENLPQPPDTGTHEVLFKTPQDSRKIAVSYPKSLLDAALSAGLAIPYSCKTGQCGSCAAICRHGTVWHAHNEVLTDADLAKGLVLTCTGHPIDDNVILSFENYTGNLLDA